MYQRQGKSAYKVDLSNTIKLATHLKSPENKFKSVHVAGTNGKGSTSHTLASVLQEAGYKVGLYTSPHLKDFRERIKINGKEVSKQFVINFVKKNKSFFEENSLSFFEMTVGMAFDYFAKKKVDIAIIEVGLGGRLDSTNIIIPEVSVITNIGLDHTQFLGTTLEEIAAEKAGIIKENIPVVIGETQDEIKSVFLKIAKERNTNLYFADTSIDSVFESDLKGTYQKNNIKTVLKTISELQELGYSISDSHIKRGLLNVIKNTGLLGRWQILQESPKVICDVAHNKEGLNYTLKQLKEESYKTLHLVLGFVSDKDLDSVIPLFPKKAKYYFCKPDISRGMDERNVKKSFQAKGYIGEVYKSVNEALKVAKEVADKEDVIYVGGSTFVVAEIL
jgi:dihydrofolate synthase/folylpolyglutamate synthase